MFIDGARLRHWETTCRPSGRCWLRVNNTYKFKFIQDSSTLKISPLWMPSGSSWVTSPMSMSKVLSCPHPETNVIVFSIRCIGDCTNAEVKSTCTRPRDAFHPLHICFRKCMDRVSPIT